MLLFFNINWLDTFRTDYVLLNHHFINTIRNSNMVRPLKGHLQGEELRIV